MLKEAIAVSAMLAAAPVAAQSDDQAPVQSEPTPSTATPGAPKAAPPIQSGRTSEPTSSNPEVTSADAAATAEDGAAQTPAPQVAQIVAREFPAYDANRNGTLEPEEFGAWMAALKARSEPGDTPSKVWSKAAFAKADADKSKAVDRVELTSFFNGTKPATA